MTISPLAGKPAPKEMLVDLVRLEREYYAEVNEMWRRHGWQIVGPHFYREV
jgi:hypothetical protein